MYHIFFGGSTMHPLHYALPPPPCHTKSSSRGRFVGGRFIEGTLCNRKRFMEGTLCISGNALWEDFVLCNADVQVGNVTCSAYPLAYLDTIDSKEGIQSLAVPKVLSDFSRGPIRGGGGSNRAKFCSEWYCSDFSQKTSLWFIQYQVSRSNFYAQQKM